MKKSFIAYFIASVCPLLLFSQLLEHQGKYNLKKDKVLFTVGYAHLDTEWMWDYPATINDNLKRTMEENFYLFEKYPDYVFNFTGSRRYQMMKEYYPDLYKKLVNYVKLGRWHISGSSVDEAEVNMSSSESLVRQVLYGNNYFRKDFGKESSDYMLPDCFGFLANTPSIWHHCGLLGFSTQKLTWHSAAGIPFNVGIWNGPDGKGLIAALNATDYNGHVVSRLDQDSGWNARLSDNIKRYGFSFDYRYYGVGDEGGAPRENDIKHVVGSLHNEDSKFKVILTSSDQMYKEITPELKKKLPVYTGDLLLIEHSAGSLTSQAYMKRLNRKNELLAQSAEQAATVADWLGGAEYPFEKLNNSWGLLLGSQFHDLLPGTALPKAYEYAWNDGFIAGNGFAEVLKNSVDVLSSQLNTQVQNRAVVVYNPVARDREDIVTAELNYPQLPVNIKVFDKTGHVVPSQIIERKGNSLKFIFEAKVPSAGLSVFDVREDEEQRPLSNSLAVTSGSLENEYYRVKIGDNGDILSIYDKKASRELLSKPARLEFLEEHPNEWPAWNMDWKDRQHPPIDYLDKNAVITILEQGPVRVALSIKREGCNSIINQVVSLGIGEAGKHVEVTNKIDWQSKEVSLKASFPLTVSNQNATYNMGVGTIERGNNMETKFEVPSKEWFDLTDQSGKYGVSILEDCKYGSDKPDDSTLRLTLLYTPKANAFNNAYIHQSSQDWGFHDFRYGIYGHAGNWLKGQSAWQGMFFNQPLLAFETPKHDGVFGKSVSLLKTSSPAVGVMALKKMEQGGYYLVRVNELTGKDQQGISISFPGKIEDAYEVNGQEQKIGDANFSKGKLNFDITHYTLRSFAVKLATPAVPVNKPAQTIVDLPYNADVFSFDHNRTDGNFDGHYSYPAEQIPAEIVSESIRFRMGSTEDEQNNAMTCKGQQILLPQGKYTKLYILAAANEDTRDSLQVDGQYYPLNVQAGSGYIGQFYNREFTPDLVKVTAIENPYSKKDNISWFASHRHIGYPSKNDAYKYCYIYKYMVYLPQGAKTITFPDNQRIKIFAATVTTGNEEVKSLQPLNDEFQNSESSRLRN